MQAYQAVWQKHYHPADFMATVLYRRQVF